MPKTALAEMEPPPSSAAERVRLDAFEWAVVALFGAIAAKDVVVLKLPSVSINIFYGCAVLAALLGAVKLVRSLHAGWRPQRLLDPAILVFAAPFLAGMWSVVRSVDRPTTVLYSLRLMVLWLVAAMIVQACRRDAVRAKAAAVFVIGAVVAAGIGYVQHYMPDLGIGTVHTQIIMSDALTRPAGFYLDANFYGMALVAACLVALGLAADAVSSSERFAWLASVVVMVPVIVATYSRTAWVGLAVGVVALLLATPRAMWPRLVAVLAVSALIGVALMGPTAVAHRAESMADPTRPGSNATRYLMARASVSMFADRPIFGTGLEGYNDVYPAYLLPGAETAVSHPHQLPLAFIAETGIMGLLAELALVILLARWAYARLRQHSGREAGFAAALLAAAVGAFFQYFLYFEIMWLFAALVAIPRLSASAPALASDAS